MLALSSSSPFLFTNEAKYHMLRTQLDKLNIISPIDHKSLDTIETMLNEILCFKQKNDNASSRIADLEERNELQALTIKAFKHQNRELFKQNAELHNEILTSLEKSNYQGKDIELKRLNDDTISLKYLLIASKEKSQQYQHELMKLKQKYMEMFVSINENKASKTLMFQEIKDNEMNDNAKYHQPGIPIESPIRNNDNSKLNNNVNSPLKNSNIGISNRMKATNQEMIERIYKLETELNDKNKEIFVLKRNINNENSLDQKVVIDYLKNELRETKEKYESYLQFNINKETNSILSKARPNSTKASKTKKQIGQRSISQETILSNNNLKQNYNKLKQENSLLKDELENLIDRFSKREKFIKAEIDRNKQNSNALKGYPNLNTIFTLNAKLKDTTASHQSSKQHYKFQINEYNRKLNIMQQQINTLNQSIKSKEVECSKYKETINILNKKLYQFTSKE